MLEGNLHTRVLQTKLTPNLASLTAIMKDETRLAIRTIVPECEGNAFPFHIAYIRAEIYPLILRTRPLGRSPHPRTNRYHHFPNLQQNIPR